MYYFLKRFKEYSYYKNKYEELNKFFNLEVLTIKV